MKTYLTLLLILLFLCSFLHANTKEEITKLLNEQNDAWNKGNLDSFIKPYDSTGVLVFIGSSGPIRSAKVLKEHYEARYKQGNDFGKLTFSDLKIEELSPGLARAWGKWLVEQKENKPASGWFSLILKKTDAGWKIIHDHSS